MPYSGSFCPTHNLIILAILIYFNNSNAIPTLQTQWDIENNNFVQGLAMNTENYVDSTIHSAS
jgi:hypothetical protein